MSNLLEDSDLSLRLIFRRHRDSSQLALLGESLYDLDGDIFSRLETPSQLDLAMYPSANLVDDLVLVYQLSPGDEILFDLGFVGSVLHMSVLV